MGNKQPLQQMVLGKVVICLQKTETISMFITLYMFITSTKEIYELINVYHFKLLSFWTVCYSTIDKLIHFVIS
jgi:hypothetical protein